MSKLLATAMLFAAIGTLAARSAEAQLTFYYDPDTGNVAFDTGLVPTGEIWLYHLELNESLSGFGWLPENHVEVTQSAFTSANNRWVSDASLSQTFGGYLTIGDVLPTGLPEDEWNSINNWYYDHTVGNPYELTGFWAASYRDENNRSHRVEEAEFVYGQPDREFDNRWDLADPDELDWAESATLVYDPATGNVTIDTSRGEGGGHISWFILESEGGFLPDNFTPWIDSPFTSATTDLIGFAADAVEPGVYSAGSILAPGLTLEEVQSTFTSARFVSRAGFGGASFDFETDGLDFGFALATAVPEPTAMVLISLAMIGFSTKRLGRS